MKRRTTLIVVLACVVSIAAAALDIHCGVVAPAGDTVVAVCRAGRMP